MGILDEAKLPRGLRIGLQANTGAFNKQTSIWAIVGPTVFEVEVEVEDDN
jgi:hypothetical protein